MNFFLCCAAILLMLSLVHVDGQSSCQDDNTALQNAGGPQTCFHLNIGTAECAADHQFGQHCKKTCATCPGGLSCSCVDTDNGKTDNIGDTCTSYAGNSGWCGQFDDLDFSSEELCCICGGGSTNGSNYAIPEPNGGYVAHCHNGVQDCDETLVDCGGAFCQSEFGCPGASGCLIQTGAYISGGSSNDVQPPQSVSSQYECAKKCAKKAGCVAWYYDSNPSYRICFLKSDANNLNTNYAASFVTGTKACGIKNCTGTYAETDPANGQRPPALTECAKPCVIESGRWGSSWCWTKEDESQWGAECVGCPPDPVEDCVDHFSTLSANDACFLNAATMNYLNAIHCCGPTSQSCCNFGNQVDQASEYGTCFQSGQCLHCCFPEDRFNDTKGCLIKSIGNQGSPKVWIVHEDNTRNEVRSPFGSWQQMDRCMLSATPMDETKYPMKYGGNFSAGYLLDITMSEAACANMGCPECHVDADCTDPSRPVCDNKSCRMDCIDNANGTTDAKGDGCSWYDEDTTMCGSYDNDDFAANATCCSCGGGIRPVEGEWGEWSTWSTCQGKCPKKGKPKNGKQMRMRRCDSPPPMNGGMPCMGKPREEKPCKMKCTKPKPANKKTCQEKCPSKKCNSCKKNKKSCTRSKKIQKNCRVTCGQCASASASVATVSHLKKKIEHLKRSCNKNKKMLKKCQKTCKVCT